MFGLIYLMFELTGHVVNTTQEYIYNTQNWINASKNGNITYVDRRGGSHLTSTGESVVSWQQISMDKVKELHLPVYCYCDTVLTDPYCKTVFYNYSEVDREERYQKKLHFRKPNETAILWKVLKLEPYAGVPQGSIYKDVNNRNLYLKRRINKDDLVVYMDFESGLLVRVADESCTKYKNDDPMIIDFIDRFNKRQNEKADWITKNKQYLDRFDFGKFVNKYYLNGYDDKTYDYDYDLKCGTVDDWAHFIMGV